MTGDQSLEGALRARLGFGPLENDRDPMAAPCKFGDDASEVAKEPTVPEKKNDPLRHRSQAKALRPVLRCFGRRRSCGT
jgi:hypothetical protein